MNDRLSASEALYGFCAWLTTREEKTIMSAHHNCSVAVERIEEFCGANGLKDPRNDYANHLVQVDKWLEDKKQSNQNSSIPGDDEALDYAGGKKLMYDGTVDTKKHIEKVRVLLSQFIGCLADRGAVHDESRLKGIEKEIFDEWTPRLWSVTYGTVEYKKIMENMKSAIRHHYKKNRHHPEHFGEDELHGMDLVDVVEMLCDWKAATLRHSDGDIKKSLKINRKRFDIPPLLIDIFENTINNMNW